MLLRKNSKNNNYYSQKVAFIFFRKSLKNKSFDGCIELNHSSCNLPSSKGNVLLTQLSVKFGIIEIRVASQLLSV